MNTPAIHQALRFYRHPEEMAWLGFPDSDLPDGMSDLLRICSSEKQLVEFSKKNELDATELSLAIFNFIEKTLLNEKNTNEKILGTDKFSTLQTQDFHYELLMKIYSLDNNKRPESERHLALITIAYQQLKKKSDEQRDVVKFSEYRKPITNKNHNPQSSEIQISNSKTAMAILSVITICSLVAMTGKFYGTSDSEIVSNSLIEENIAREIKAEDNIVNQNSPELIKLVSSIPARKNTNNNITKPTIKATSTLLQALLKDLEIAYEKGDVDTIKPILANAPEIQNQTAEQLNDKLETLFEITSERKMVLFDFDWTDASGALQGKGSFISRYQLVGEKKWLTRQGTALVSAQKIDNQLKVTQLIFQNQPID